MTASENDENPDKPGKICRPSVPVIDSLTSMSIIERKLSKLFKCCFFRDKCFFTTDDANSFLKHLNTCHKDQEVSCIYCFYQSGETEPYDQTERLIDHILVNHGLRLFQCNLCVYRGSTIPHVLLHQANIHGNKYQTTLTGDGTVGMCKVLVCKQIVSGPLPSETVYWSNCKVERIINDSNEPPKYQCLYCDFCSFIPHVVFFHVCKVHPDYSLILFDKYVDQLPEIKEAEEKTEGVLDDEDAELDAIVHDLHSIDTKDDDVDMTPVDDAPPEDLSEDDNIPQSQPSSSEVTRERLFALKGVRIAKKQPEPQLPGKARKSTAKPVVASEPDFDQDEDDYVPLTARQKIMRGYRPEQSAALFKPVALTGNNALSRNWLKCLICNDNTKLTKVAIESHLMLKHNTTSSFKCSECTFVGSSREISAHFKAIHGDSDSTVKFIKFIVALDEAEEASIPMLSQPVRSGDPSSSTKSRRKGPDKDPKNLSSKIKRSVFIGPKSWKEKQKRQRKEMTGQDSDDSGAEVELNQDEQGMDVDMDEDVIGRVVIASGETRESDRFPYHRKRKASEMEDVPKGPVSIEELLTFKSSRERGSEFFFCLFCSSLSTKNFSEAQAHMKRHLGLNLLTCPECPTFECETIQELKKHNENAHPTKYIPLPNMDENNMHINYITEFFNEQFLRRRKGDQMTADQAARYARIICPICERANQITQDTNFHFTKWRAFKTHFWKHANASFIKCLKCGALVPRTRKRVHLESNHPEDIDGSASDIKDFTPFYHDSLPELALYSLKSSKRVCKAFYLSRIREEFEVGECCVVLRRIKDPEDMEMVKVKEEPIDSLDFF